jgi:sulfide:quinone oxidoreductase
MMLIHAQLEERGLRGRTTLEIRTVEPRPMATAGPDVGNLILGELKKRDIGFFAGTKVARVERGGEPGGDATRSGSLVLEGDVRVPFDLLIAIPPHEAPRAVAASALAGPSGWIPVDPLTTRCARGDETGRVYAIGDVTSVALPGRFTPDVGLSLPKAGVFAERQAIVAASQIAGRIRGDTDVKTFDGTGFCYIEMGGGTAMRGDGSFFALPHPSMTPTEASSRRYEEKREWAEEWVRRYL